MALDILKERGVPLERQTFTWKDLVKEPISKLDNDAFTRVRIILMNGIEQEQNRFLHAFALANEEMRLPLARVRRIEHHQQTAVNWLLGADHSPLETTLAYEQVAIEVTAAIAQAEPDAYLAQVHRFGLLEDFDHLYRFAALYDRLYGRDANNILQSYTDILPGRPTSVEHRAPVDDLRRPYDGLAALPASKVNALTILAGENQVRDYYMVVGPMFADPLARQLYAEIASIEEQHVTQYESITDPNETWMEKWLLHELTEVYNYYSCVETEGDPRVRTIWERFLDYELGHLQFVMEQFRRVEGRDPEELMPAEMPAPIPYKSQRAFVRDVLAKEVAFSADGENIGDLPITEQTAAYRAQVNADGSPSDRVAVGYRYTPGTELSARPVTHTSIAGARR